MAKTTAEVIREITINHLSSNEGLLFGQSLKGAGWLGGTIPNCDGLVDLPITDIAGPGFAVGAALMGVRPIFLVRYQGFLWLNASPIINYAAKSLSIWIYGFLLLLITVVFQSLVNAIDLELSLRLMFIIVSYGFYYYIISSVATYF